MSEDMNRLFRNMVIVGAIILFINSCNSSSEPIPFSPEQIYPAGLIQIGRVKADSIQNTIRSNDFVSYIDEYGLFSFSGTLGRGNSNITDKNVAIRLAKEALLKYSKYSNVSDTSKLELKETANNNSSPLHFTDWIITFKNQKYNGIEVLNTGIIVIVHNQVSQIIGHHFKNISIPVNGIVPKDKLVEILSGKKLETMCWTKIEVTITPEMILKNKIAQNIIWQEVKNSIEFRVAWNVPITTSKDENVSWNVWVDILSGEILLYSPTFIC
jgi:hypothetical protein